MERAATLEDVRAEVLAPERLNAFVFSGFAGVALLIAVVGVAGVLAFSVSARTREFGVRLAIGSTPRHLLMRVLSEGALIVAIGIVAGAAGGYAFARVAASYLENVRLPGALPMLGAAAVLVGAAVARVADARRARVARGRAAGAPVGVECPRWTHEAGTRSRHLPAQLPLSSGFVALYAVKGGTLHRKSGMVFVCAMLVMSLSGAVMAVGRAGTALNVPAGLVTAYLVITSLATVRPPSADRTGWIAPPWWRRSRSARAASWSRSPVAPAAVWRFRS